MRYMVFGQKIRLNPRRTGIMVLCIAAVLLAGMLVLTGLYVYDSIQYETVHGTVIAEEEATETFIRYVVKGEPYFEEINRVPRSWEPGDLVKIEYKMDHPEDVRVPKTVGLYVLGLIFCVAFLGFGYWMFKGCAGLKKVKELNIHVERR